MEGGAEMIPLVEEPKDLIKEFGVYEICCFGCGRKTKYWHDKTNQPVCKECAKIHKVSELKKSNKKYNPNTKIKEEQK